VWLILNGLAYLAQNFTGVLFPQYADSVVNIGFPFQLGEIAIVLWLVVMGARDRRVMTPVTSSHA
jgi:hypothetical protein